MSYVYSKPQNASPAAPVRGCRVRIQRQAPQSLGSMAALTHNPGYGHEGPGGQYVRRRLIRPPWPPRPPLTPLQAPPQPTGSFPVHRVFYTPYSPVAGPFHDYQQINDWIRQHQAAPMSIPAQPQIVGWVWLQQFTPGQPIDYVPGMQIPTGAGEPRAYSTWQPVYDSTSLANYQNAGYTVSAGATRPNYTPPGAGISATQTQAPAAAAVPAASAHASTGTSLLSFVSSIPWWGWGAAAVGGYFLLKGGGR